MSEQRDLEGLGALVTGATSGIGRAAAEELGRPRCERARLAWPPGSPLARLPRPAWSPGEQFHRAVSECLEEWWRLQRVV